MNMNSLMSRLCHSPIHPIAISSRAIPRHAAVVLVTLALSCSTFCVELPAQQGGAKPTGAASTKVPSPAGRPNASPRTERLIGPLRTQVRNLEWIRNEAGAYSLVYVTRGAAWEALVVNGKIGKQYQAIDDFATDMVKFSPDGTHQTYRVERGKKKITIVDGQEGTEFERTDYVLPNFSPDSQHVSYRGESAKKWMVVVDKKVGPEYDETGSVYFSSDSKHFAYKARRGQKWLIAFDGHEGRQYDQVSLPKFSADGKHWAYGALDGQNALVVIDGQVESKYTSSAYMMLEPTLANDGKRLALKAEDAQQHSVVILDGQESPLYDKVERLSFSPNGKHVAYLATKNVKTFAVIDGQGGPPYDEVQNPVFFSANDEHTAYAGYNGNRTVMVVDGKIGTQYDSTVGIIYNPHFSEDGKHVAFIATQGAEQFVVLDGAEGPHYDGIADSYYSGGDTLVFSPVADHLAYVSRRGTRQLVVVDSRERGAYEEVRGVPVFSPDGKHFAYFARNKKQWILVADDRELAHYDHVPPLPSFEPDGRLSFLAVNDGVLYQVEWNIADALAHSIKNENTTRDTVPIAKPSAADYRPTPWLEDFTCEFVPALTFVRLGPRGSADPFIGIADIKGTVERLDVRGHPVALLSREISQRGSRAVVKTRYYGDFEFSGGGGTSSGGFQLWLTSTQVKELLLDSQSVYFVGRKTSY